MKESAISRKPGQESTTRTADRSLGLLRLVADRPGATLAELARGVALPASTALRHLRNLEQAGFVARSDDGRFEPGGELLRIALALTAGRPLPRLAQPHLDLLSASTGESAYLAVAAGPSKATYVAVAPGRHAIRHASWLGQQVSRRSTALGAALAGRVDADGAVVRVDAVESGVTAVAAPVRGASGAVVASISVVGPTFRLDGAALHTARRAVAERAGSLTSELTAELRPR